MLELASIPEKLYVFPFPMQKSVTVLNNDTMSSYNQNACFVINMINMFKRIIEQNIRVFLRCLLLAPNISYEIT